MLTVTDLEKMFLTLKIRGLSDDEIKAGLKLSDDNFYCLASSLTKKLKAKTAFQAAIIAIKNNII